MVNEFFMFEYFKIKESDTQDDRYKKFAERAYLDLCRTIRFTTEDVDKKIEYKNVVCDKLAKEHNFLCNAVNTCSSDEEKQELIDRDHNRICEEICKTYAEISEFTYGQAQKWLNMMLKYVLLIEGDSILKNYLHIPVDSYIMQAVGSDTQKLEYCLGLECVPKKNGAIGKYSESTSKPWSKWNYDEYIAFQNSIRKAISESDYRSSIEWENDAWIEVAALRK